MLSISSNGPCPNAAAGRRKLFGASCILSLGSKSIGIRGTLSPTTLELLELELDLDEAPEELSVPLPHWLFSLVAGAIL